MGFFTRLKQVNKGIRRLLFVAGISINVFLLYKFGEHLKENLIVREWTGFFTYIETYKLSEKLHNYDLKLWTLLWGSLSVLISWLLFFLIFRLWLWIYDGFKEDRRS